MIEIKSLKIDGKDIDFDYTSISVYDDGRLKSWELEAGGVDIGISFESVSFDIEAVGENGQFYTGKAIMKSWRPDPNGSYLILLGSGPLNGYE